MMRERATLKNGSKVFLRGALLIVPAVLLSACGCKHPPELRKFKSDGCTLFFEGTPSNPCLWYEDCREHDLAYWKGGTREERKQADLKLREGIREKGKPVVAFLMYAGVRMGGTPWLPTPWRWGFGWKGFPCGYRELGKEETSSSN